MPVVSEDDLKATGLSERILETYRLAGGLEISPTKRKKLAKKLGVAESTITRHLSQVRVKIDRPSLTQPTKSNFGGGLSMEERDNKKYAQIVSKLADPYRSIAAVAREVGVSPDTASRIAKELELEMQPVKRAIEEVRLEDLTKLYGTLARDSANAITQEKLDAATAQQLAVISGIAVDKWQLLRGQPTQRTEIGDRRQSNELMAMLFKEARRRGIEIDVTPEGGTTAKKSPFRNAAHQREVKKIESGDPAETLAPA